MLSQVKTASRQEWLSLRRGYIGGSDAASVVGLNPFCSPYSLWAEKTGKIPEFSGNLATEVGTYLEEFIAKKFEQDTGKRVRRNNHSIFNSEYPFAIADIDREIIGEDAGLEIKSTDSINLKHFKGGDFPANYYCQCVHYLAVTGKKRWYLAVLIGNREFKRYCIERDDAEIAALMAAEADFWKMVQSDTPPAIDGTSSTSETIRTIYSDSDDTACDLAPHVKTIATYFELKHLIDDMQQQADGLLNSIKDYMGSSSYGATDGHRVTWKSQTRRTFDYKKFSEDNPDMDLSQYFKESTSRPFRIN